MMNNVDNGGHSPEKWLRGQKQLDISGKVTGI